jgi:hypothetical protein
MFHLSPANPVHTNLFCSALVVVCLAVSSFPARAFEVEPNDSKATATEVSVGAGGEGTLRYGVDPRDWLWFESPLDGTVHVRLAALGPSLNPDILAEDELGNFLDGASGPSQVETLDLPVATGDVVYLKLVAASGRGNYWLSLFLEAAAPGVYSDDCGGSCPAGTTVTLFGSNFGVDPDAVRVEVSDVQAEVTAALDTELDFVVPYGAVDGDLYVSVLGNVSDPYAFVMGDASPPPPTEYTEPSPSFLDQGPDGDHVYVNSMGVSFAPAVDQASAEAVLDQAVLDLGYAGYTLVGRNPFDNTWQVEFDGPTVYADVLDLIDELATFGEVDGLIPEQVLSATGMRWDSDPLADDQTSSGDAASRYAAFQKSGFVDAWDLYRTSTVTVDASREARVWVVDTGFNDANDQDNFPQDNFTSYRRSPFGWIQGEIGNTGVAYHGTAVASVIGAANLLGAQTDGVSGALAGFQSDLLNDDNDPTTPSAGPESIPYEVVTYACGNYNMPNTFNLHKVSLALTEIAKLSNAGDGHKMVVNISMADPYGEVAQNNSAADLDTIDELMWRTRDRVLYVISAGNNHGLVGQYFPGALALDHDNVIAVAASFPYGGIGVDGRWIDPGPPSQGSAKGRRRDVIVAPGHDVPVFDVRVPGYSTDSGTSFAAPFVSSAAAMALFLVPDLTPSDLVSLLDESGDDVSSLWNKQLRRLNVRNMLRRLSWYHGNPAPMGGLTYAYTADEGSDEVSSVELDPAYQVPIQPYHVVYEVSPGGCDAPVDVVASPDGFRLYALCEGSMSMVILDAETLELLREVPLPAGYSLGSGGRMAIDAEEIVAIPMQDGSQVLLALYEGRTDTWMDDDPYELSFNEIYASDVTALPMQSQELWVQGYSASFEPGTLRQVLLEPRDRDLTAGDLLDLATQFPNAYPPKGIDASHEGQRVYAVFGDDSTDPEQIDVQIGGSWTGSTCGSILGNPLERPFDIAVDPQGSGYAYLAHWETGTVTQLNLGSMDCEAMLEPYYVYSRPERVALTPDGGTVLGTYPDLNTLVVFPHDPAYNSWYDLLPEWEVGVNGSSPLGVDSRPSVSVIAPRPETRVEGVVRFEVAVRDAWISEVQIEAYDDNDDLIHDDTYTRWADDGVLSDFVADMNNRPKPIRLEVTTTYSPPGYADWTFTTEVWYR